MHALPKRDSNAAVAVWLLGWFLTVWSLATCAAAVADQTLVQRRLEAAHYPGAQELVVVPLVILACALVVGEVAKSWMIIMLGDIFGAILCITNAIFVFPELFKQGAGPEVVNWVHLSAQFLVLGVLMTLNPEALEPDVIVIDSANAS